MLARFPAVDPGMFDMRPTRVLGPVAAWLAACLMLLAADVRSGVLVPGPEAGDLAAGPAMDMLVDRTGVLGIPEASSPLYADRYRPVGDERINEGFTRDALWFRIRLDLSAGHDRRWYLVEGNPLLDELTLFMPDGAGGWQSLRLGDSRPFRDRPLALREQVMPLPPALATGDEPVTLYLRAAGEGALNLAPRLMDDRALAERVSVQQWAFGLFYGAMAILFLYNLLVYLVARERAQWHYCVWLGGFILLFLSLNGVGLQYLWPGLPQVNGWFPLFTGIALVGALGFTRLFLELDRDTPRLANAFGVLVKVIVGLMVVGVLLPRQWSYVLGNLLPLVFAVVMLAAGIWRLRQGYRPARLFVAGWGVLLLGAMLLPLGALGLLPLNAVTQYSTQYGAVLQGILLSLALGDRLRLLKQENERIQFESRERLEAMFRQLSALDADKLRFLQYLGRELNAPVGWLGSAAVSGADGPQVRALVDSVEAGRQRMMDLVATVLRYFDLAAEQPGKSPVAPMAPMWLVDALLREQAPLLEARRLRVVNRVPAELVVNAHEGRYRRALATLIDNAIRFSEDGGEIEIIGGTETYGRDGYVAVRDQGRGIAPDHLPHLFEPFFNGGSRHRDGGFGLSLAIARLLARHMGGELRASSPGRGQGATFTLVMPLAAVARSPREPAQNPAA